MLGSALNFQVPAHDLLDDRPQKRPRNGEPAPTPDKDNLKGTKRLSCRECRRLKLKCDRVFPCQSCCKRGCAEICPEGALQSGRGSRFILANTEQLHEKITQLSERVRQLEDGLESFSAEHPLLAPDLRRIKTSQELYVPPNAALTSDAASAPIVAPDILQLSVTFPFPWSVDLKIRQRIRDALPPRAEAQALYNLDPSRTFIDLLIHSVYTTPIQELSPRRLALLLMVLSIGSLVDLSRPLGSLHGEAYHHLARAAVCEIPLMEEPDFDELHALFFMIWYHLVFSDNRKAVGYAWNLMGFVAKLAQGLGLHRDGSRLKVIPRRVRAAARNILGAAQPGLPYGQWCQSLSLGRPPSLSLSHVDTKPPAYTESTHVPKDEILYHEWKNAFFIKCLSPILEAVAAVTPPEYKQLLELDARARDFHSPPALDNSGATARFLVMQRALVASGRDIAILQLHRRCFTEALSGAFVDLHHSYAPSVLATYIGASSLIATLETLFDREPQLSARFLHFWFNAFSATVTLSLFVSRAPATSLAPYALQDLDRVCRLFRRVATLLPFSAKSLPIMEKLAEKARRACSQWHSAVPPPPPSSVSGAQLPPAFHHAHPTLAQYAEEMTFAPPRVPLPGHPPLKDAAMEADAETWLPDVYRFSSHGVGIDERYRISGNGSLGGEEGLCVGAAYAVHAQRAPHRSDRRVQL
ncbi:4Fe-4S ferredoxin-type domain-containing protein [Mycena venus]|uniref:4Fe-4S ferredoxin-type domain-containing protein n=1 Tax=Mycena venus TaxID=2733690 RepID=A0A8H7D896_9AGAR|nr:4Fe-4S ferredoxin-type domain-containing protein [Mycena venus]